jgi:quinol-cytochrome oxidoreductase complex cytochrome b subunit
MTEEVQQTQSEKTIPFFPDHITTEAYVAVAVLVILVGFGIWGQLSPVGLEAPADPLQTPAHTKPEWYFLFLYQFLKFDSIPMVLGWIGLAVGILIPYVWRSLEKDQARPSRAKWVIGTAISAASVFLLANGGDIPEWFSIFVVFAGLAVIFIWPFVDSEADTVRQRRNRIIMSVIFLMIVVYLTALGADFI